MALKIEVLESYSQISEIELFSRISYYDSNDFSAQTIEWLVPDVDAYVKKIFNCLRWAEQSRKIIEDICNQISECRKDKQRVINSVEYKIGNLYVDGRAYVQQNVHMYCQYISEINDCLSQILKIVYDNGFRLWDDINSSKIIKKLKHNNNIIRLCEKFRETIVLYKNFDNYGKHNLVLWGTEKLLPKYFLDIEYHFDSFGEQHKMSDFINELQEKKIKRCVVELLDNIFADANSNKYPQRKYVTVSYDFKLTPNTRVIYDKKILSQDMFLPICYKTKIKDGLTYTESINYCCESLSVEPVLYLALLNQELDNSNRKMIDTIKFNEFDVYSNNIKIGKYVCKDSTDKTVRYFHFKKFEFEKM